MKRALVYTVSRIFALFCATTTISTAAVFTATPENYRDQIALLQAGDVLRLSPGLYTQGLSLNQINGTQANPIVITGPETDEPALFIGSNTAPTISIRESSYITISHLLLDGLQRIGHGVSSQAGDVCSHHVTLENNYFRGFDAGRPTAAISTEACSATGWRIRNNIIDGAGTGITLGKADGHNPFVAGVIENNLVKNTLGYQLRINSGLGKTLIRHNAFGNEFGVGDATFSRARVFLGGSADLNDFGSGNYEVYGNFFYNNPHGALLHAKGDIALYKNLFVTVADAVWIIQHEDSPIISHIFQNTIVAGGRGIYVSDGDNNGDQWLRGNAVFATYPMLGVESTDNIIDDYPAAGNYLRSPYAPLGSLNLNAKPGALLGIALDGNDLNAYNDWSLDYTGQAQTSNEWGALGNSSQNAVVPGDLALKLVISQDSTVNSKPLELPIPNPSLSPSAQPETNPDALSQQRDPPSVSINSSAETVFVGDQILISWNSTDAESCVASGDWTGKRDIQGSEVIRLLSDREYTLNLSCYGAGGEGSDTLTLLPQAPNDTPPPEINLTLQKDEDNSVIVSWDVTNAEACVASGIWEGNKNVVGEEQLTGPFPETAEVVLTCSGQGGSASESIVVIAENKLITTTTEKKTKNAAFNIYLVLLCLFLSFCIRSSLWKNREHSIRYQ